jgi:S-adenosylmethionine/arginine decarboxylase-like enzyme
MPPAKPFGYLLTLDLYGCTPGACDDIGSCYDFLVGLVDALQMTRQGPPHIYRSDAEEYPDKAGLSGWVGMIESGIQIHTLTPKNFISIDVYCCREFDPDRVALFARKWFAPREVEMNRIARGLKYHDVT